MFDKIVIESVVSDDACLHLANKHSLWTTVDGKGSVVRYATSMVSRIDGVDLRLNVTGKGNILTLKTSLHKYWKLRTMGTLRNDGSFTMNEAKFAFSDFLFEYGLLPENVWVKQFEIGLNLEVSHDPLSFIEKVPGIVYNDKQMYADVNFPPDRQRTTVKSRHFRKYFKMYDKSYEMQEKKRGKARLNASDGRFILRIETVFRRHKERGDSLFSDNNLKRLESRFYSDWSGIFFVKKIHALKGAKKSEVERAEKIINEGREIYLERMKKEYDEHKMTAKQYRTIREFVRDFEANSHRFNVIVSPQETEYRLLLKEKFEKTRHKIWHDLA